MRVVESEDHKIRFRRVWEINGARTTAFMLFFHVEIYSINTSSMKIKNSGFVCSYDKNKTGGNFI